jgi:hypothetical protein
MVLTLNTAWEPVGVASPVPSVPAATNCRHFPGMFPDEEIDLEPKPSHIELTAEVTASA